MGAPAISENLFGGIDERNQERWLLVNFLRIFNAENGELLGHLVNVTTEGLMFISEQHFAIDHEFRLKMEIPTEDGKTTEIELNVRTIWSKADEDPFYYKTGLQLIHCSEDSIRVISAQIEKLKQLQTNKYNPPEVDYDAL